MKIQYLSDMHCEFYHDGGRKFIENLPVSGDVLVVAGDLVTCEGMTQAITWLCEKFPQLIYVTGNHEYYRYNRNDVNSKIIKLKRRLQNFHPLNAETTEIEGQRFIGATGWFPNGADNWKYSSALNDFRMIEGFKKWNYKVHNAQRKYLLENVRSDDVVITHHAPSWGSVHSRFVGSPYNCFYVSDFEDVIKECSPKIWIHGHVHNKFDYTLGSTRILANPVGYPGENRYFDPKLTIEI
jgi:Icc-related predicted phosphoesterase